jgi:hypothetical protein
LKEPESKKFKGVCGSRLFGLNLSTEPEVSRPVASQLVA